MRAARVEPYIVSYLGFTSPDNFTHRTFTICLYLRLGTNDLLFAFVTFNNNILLLHYYSCGAGIDY